MHVNTYKIHINTFKCVQLRGKATLGPNKIVSLNYFFSQRNKIVKQFVSYFYCTS